MARCNHDLYATYAVVVEEVVNGKKAKVTVRKCVNCGTEISRG